MKRTITALAVAAGASAATVPAPGWGQNNPDYPSRAVNFVVPFTPGGTTDILARLFGIELEAALGVPFTVENRGGAGATLGAAYVANATPDGYTILLSNSASHGVAPAVYSQIPYDAVEDFRHIALLGRVPQYLIVNRNLGVSTIEEFLELVRANPGGLNMGTAGDGSMGHIATALFTLSSGVEILQVPYNGTAPATQALLGNEVQALFSNPPSSAPLIDAGEVTLIAVTGTEREAAYPDIPTLAESGMPDSVTYAWYGISVPAGTPDPVVERLSTVLGAILARDDMRARLLDLGVAPAPQMSPEEVQDFVRSTSEAFQEAAAASNIRLD